MDKGGDIGRMGEIGDRFRIAFASIISDPRVVGLERSEKLV